MTRGTSGCFSYSYDNKSGWLTTTVYYNNRCKEKRQLKISWGTHATTHIVSGRTKGSTKGTNKVESVWDGGKPR